MELEFSAYTQNNQWDGADKAIKQWLDTRQSLLITYNKLCVIKPKSHTEFTAERVITFCNQLVDYVSAGHFDIFEKIAAATEKTGAASFNVALLQQILETTMSALDFNDKYLSTGDYSTLADALSALGQDLAHRFELEDQLIQLYLKATGLKLVPKPEPVE